MTTSNSDRPPRRRSDRAVRRDRPLQNDSRRVGGSRRRDAGVPPSFTPEQAARREELRLDRFRTQAASIVEALRAMIRGVFGRKLPADRVLAEFLRAHRGCGSRDRAAISAVCYAVMRFYGALRTLLPEAVSGRIERGETDFSPEELGALGCCALFFEGEHRELGSSLAKLYGLPAVSAPTAAAPWEKRAAAAAKFAGADFTPPVTSLLPEEFSGLVQPDFHRLCKLCSRRPPMWLRLQGGDPEETLRELAASGMTVRRHPVVGSAVAATGGKVNIFTLDSFRRGGFEVQDLASQCVGLVCAPRAGERWLDACAGGGGKTLELAELMRRRGTVIAGDIREGALRQLRLRARRAGFPNISTLIHEGRVPRGFHPCDGVLVDAPCSGSGVWRRNPGSAWKFQADEIPGFAARQLEILSRFASAVKPGGVLVYATCSIFTAENDEVVRRFLAAHPEFALESGNHPLTGEISDGMYRFEGFADDCDFLFAARMRRKYEAAV